MTANPLTEPVSELIKNATEASDFLKRLANPQRLMIACALVDGERSVRDLEDTLELRQPALSQQIAELRRGGLVVGRKQSKSVFYRLADERVRDFIQTMHRLFCAEGRPEATDTETRKQMAKDQ